MKYLFILAIFLSSCSHKIGSVVTTTQKSDSSETVTIDTSSELSIDTTHLPPVIVHDTINFDSFCDSLKNGFFPEIRTEKIYIHTTSKGVSPIECKTDSLEQVNSRMLTVIKEQHEKIKQIETTVHQTDTVNQSFIADVWFWIAVTFMVLLVVGLRRK